MIIEWAWTYVPVTLNKTAIDTNRYIIVTTNQKPTQNMQNIV